MNDVPFRKHMMSFHILKLLIIVARSFFLIKAHVTCTVPKVESTE
jgi:hypothetical protein